MLGCTSRVLPVDHVCRLPYTARLCEEGKIGVGICGGLRRWSARSRNPNRLSRPITECGAGWGLLVGAAPTCRVSRARRCDQLAAVTLTPRGAPVTRLHRRARHRLGERCTRVSGKHEGAAQTAAMVPVLVLEWSPAIARSRHEHWHAPRGVKVDWEHVPCIAQVAHDPRGEGHTGVGVTWRGRGS